MPLLAHPLKITVDEFLKMDFGDRKAELVDGFIRMMAGGTRVHARLQTNVLVALGNALQGGACRPFGSDMAFRIDAETLRYPDVSVYCGEEIEPEHDGDLAGRNPTVLIEILSDSTRKEDQGPKLIEYQSVASVRTIALIDPASEFIRTYHRHGEHGWIDSGPVRQDALDIPALSVAIPAADIFAR